MSIIKLPKNSIEFFKSNQDKIFESGNLAEGPWNDQLSKKIKSITNSKNAICVNSNGSGLVALLLIYKEYYGRTDVMIQSNTMYGVKTMTKTAGYNLVDIIDCQLETLMPSFNDLKKAINNYKGEAKKLVIMLSDIGGIINPDIEKIAKFCKEKNIILIEDSAHSFGATLNSKFSGTFGNAGVYSYYSTKAIFAGEGGIVVTDNDNIGNVCDDYDGTDIDEDGVPGEIDNCIKIANSDQKDKDNDGFGDKCEPPPTMFEIGLMISFFATVILVSIGTFLVAVVYYYSQCHG